MKKETGQVRVVDTVVHTVNTISTINKYLSPVVSVLKPVYIPCPSNMGTCISGSWRWTGWPILFCWPSQELSPATLNTGKKVGRGFGTNEWTGKLERDKFLVVGEAFTALFRPSQGFKGRTFNSCRSRAEGTLISASEYPTVGTSMRCRQLDELGAWPEM